MVSVLSSEMFEDFRLECEVCGAPDTDKQQAALQATGRRTMRVPRMWLRPLSLCPSCREVLITVMRQMLAQRDAVLAAATDPAGEGAGDRSVDADPAAPIHSPPGGTVVQLRRGGAGGSPGDPAPPPAG